MNIEEEVTTPAGPALQFSFAFAAPDENAVGSSGQIRFGLAGPNVRINVPSGGATLEELAVLVNTDSQNGGRLLATVVESDGDYRLRVETTATGSSERIRINRDDFGLFDSAMAQENGTDESTVTVTSEEDLVFYSDVVSFEDVEAEVLVEDEAFQALSEEFVVAFNAFQSELGARRFAAGDVLGASLSSRRDGLSDSLTDLTAGLADRVGTSGTTLADFGLEATAGGELRLDTIGFQRALAERPAEAIELIASRSNSLARDVSSVLGGASSLASEAAVAASELTTRGRFDQVARLLSVFRDTAF